ncbi:MAG: zf-HC2 domain-containing protein [Gemmatimonadota bacterium]
MMNDDHDMDSNTASNAASTDHPSAGEIAAYVDGMATDEQRRRLETHLARCAPCREDLAVVREAVRSKPSRLRWVAGAAAAAAIVLLLLTPSMLDDGSVPTLRGPDAADPGTASSIEVVAPREAAVAPAAGVRFVWRAAGPDAQYRFTITTAAGDAVAAVTTADTVVTSLDGADLTPDTEYYWWVEALRADRETTETGLRRFRTAP